MSGGLLGGHRVIRCDVVGVERGGRCPSMVDLDLYGTNPDHWRSLGWTFGDGDVDVCPFHSAMPGRHHDAADRAARVAAARRTLDELGGVEP